MAKDAIKLISQNKKAYHDFFIEETYEVIEAIDNDDPVLMCEELGDVMLQTVFHADIEREAGRFTVEDVLDGITDKLIHRHPHVFGDVKADTSEKVLDNWDKIKKKEKGRDFDEKHSSGASRAYARSKDR